MLVASLLLALGVIYCFAVFRWTQELRVWQRRLIRALLLSLLCPAFVLQDDGIVLSPTIFYLTFGWHDLKLEIIEKLFIQTLVAGAALYSAWLAVAGISQPHSDNPAQMRQVKRIAIICSLPSWALIAGFIFYRIWLDGKHWPHFDFLTTLCFICTLCSLASMTMLLISMNDFSISSSDILLFLWSAFPIVLGIFIGCLLWFSINFGGASMEDYYG